MAKWGVAAAWVVLVGQVYLSQAQEAAVAFTSCVNGHCTTSNNQRASGFASAHGESTDANGVTTGECAYTNEAGKTIKMRYRQTPNGQVEVKVNDPSVTDGVAALEECRRYANAVNEQVRATVHRTNQEIQGNLQNMNERVRQNNLRIQDNIRRQHEQIARQQEQLQQNLFHQQQNLFNQPPIPVFGGPNPFNFPDGGFGF